MRVSHTVEYYTLISMAWVLRTIPRKMALGIASAIGAIGWSIGIRRQLVISNLRQALPEASDEDLHKIAKQSSRNFLKTSAEFIRFGRKDRDGADRLIKVEGKEAVLEALKEGNGVILLTGHFGAWASYFAALAIEGIPLALLVGKQHNERVDKFIHSLSGEGVELITKGKTAIRVILQKLKAGRAVVMVSDQHAGKTGIMSSFFGRDTPTLALPSSFSVKHKVPVFTFFGHRETNGSHRVVIKPLNMQPCETDEEQKTEILRAYHKELEKTILERPDQYFWFHRRWRDEDLSNLVTRT